jgi:hypothetical protein
MLDECELSSMPHTSRVLAGALRRATRGRRPRAPLARREASAPTIKLSCGGPPSETNAPREPNWRAAVSFSVLLGSRLQLRSRQLF